MKPPPPEYLKGAVVYQLVLRSFTRDGNFRAAERMLGHVRSAGVDAIYLAPFVEMSRDMDESGWSARQKASGFHTPKNPYRISDYDKIDPEYGTDADFASFNAAAHALGMRVFVDLVYLHCGPDNVLKDSVPDAFQRNSDGSVRTTIWNFPFVNFGSRAVRRRLIDSMLHWVRLGCDGFRCDVGDQVPVDFWEEAFAACRAERPDLATINEGTKAEWLERAFDACYAWPWSFVVRDALVHGKANGFLDAPPWKGAGFAARMDAVREYEGNVPAGALMFCFLDNHDTAADDGEDRFDRRLPVEAGNAAFVATFLRRGIPLLFNGNEIADNARSSFFAAVEDVSRARMTVDWARALQPEGRKRLALVRTLAGLRHGDPVFSDGTQEWVTAGEESGAVAFVRRLGERAVFVAADLAGKGAAFRTDFAPVSGAAPLPAEGGRLGDDGVCRLDPHGYVVAEVRNV